MLLNMCGTLTDGILYNRVMFKSIMHVGISFGQCSNVHKDSKQNG